MLTTTPVLQAPDFGQPFKVETDPSEVGLDAVLTQESQEGEHVITSASCPLHVAGKEYLASEECLAEVWAVEKWQHYLEWKHFTVITDHFDLGF